MFDLRPAYKEGFMSDEKDVSLAFQILQEQGKNVAEADWFHAFTVRCGIDENSRARSRFQNAVRDLEFLGFTERQNAINTKYRRLLLL